MCCSIRAAVFFLASLHVVRENKLHFEIPFSQNMNKSVGSNITFFTGGRICTDLKLHKFRLTDGHNSYVSISQKCLPGQGERSPGLKPQIKISFMDKPPHTESIQNKGLV